MPESIRPPENAHKEATAQTSHTDTPCTPQESLESPLQSHRQAKQNNPPEDALTAEGSHYRTTEEIREHMERYGVAVNAALVAYVHDNLPHAETRGLIDADDVIQETLLAWLSRESKTSPEKYDTEAGELKWMYGIARNHILRAKTAYATRRDRLLPEGHEDDFELLEDRHSLVEAQVVDNQAQDTLSQVLQLAQEGLSERYKKVLELIIEDPGIELTELAAALGTSYGAARAAKTRALHTFNQNLLDVCQGLDQTDPTIERILGLVEKKNSKRVQRSITEYDGPSITPEAQRQKLAAELAHSRDEAEMPSAALYVPHYIGMWSVAAYDIAGFADTHDQSMIGIAYPHEALLQDFTAYIGRIVGNKVLESLQIGTPQMIAQAAQGHNFDYIVGPGEAMRSNRKAFEGSGFQLHLFNAGEPRTAEPNIHESPLYSKMGVRKVIWSNPESLRYLQEYRFTTGKSMDRSTAQALSSSGQGPSHILTSKEYGGWTNLAAAAESLR